MITISLQMERLTRSQPLRTLHLTYIVMDAVVRVAGQFVLKKLWRWAWLSLPIAAGMKPCSGSRFRSATTSSGLGRATGSYLVEAFNWVKANTPVDAETALALPA